MLMALGVAEDRAFNMDRLERIAYMAVLGQVKRGLKWNWTSLEWDLPE